MTDTSYQTFYANLRWYVGYHDDSGKFHSVDSREGNYHDITVQRWAERRAQELNRSEAQQ